MPTAKFSDTTTFTLEGATVPIGGEDDLTYTMSTPISYPVPAETACMQTFQLSNDGMSIVEGGKVTNNTPYPVTISVNGNGETIQPGGYRKWYSPWQGSGDNPAALVEFTTEVFHTLEGSIDGILFGRP